MSQDRASLTARHKRPRFVTILAFSVLFLSTVNLWSVYSAVTRSSLFSTLNLNLPLWLATASGAVWGLLWLVLAWGLWRLYAPARKVTLITLPIYALYRNGIQLIFVTATYERNRLPFLIVVTGTLLIVAILGLTRQNVRQAFEQHRGALNGARPKD